MKYFCVFVLSFLMLNVFAQSDYVWETFENPLMLDSGNANTITEFENTPESIVSYFYASRIRKDSDWEKVILSEELRSEKLKRKLITYETWNITKFHLVKKTEYANNKLWIKIFFEIEVNGHIDSGTDEVSVDFVNGKWVITSIPT